MIRSGAVVIADGIIIETGPFAVIAPNFPPKIGGIESFVAGLAGNAWPGSTAVVAPPAPGAEPWDEAPATTLNVAVTFFAASLASRAASVRLEETGARTAMASEIR